MNKTSLLDLDTRKSFSTFVDLLQCRANEHPSRVAYSFLKDGEVEQEKVSYLELDEGARKIAAYLQSKKLEGERVLLIFQPGSEFVTAFMACLYAGVVAVPVHPPHNQNLSRIEHIVVNAEARLILTSSKLIEKLKSYSNKGEDISKLNLVVIEEIDPLFIDEYKLPRIEKNSLAFLQYTSGSTGSPKGVMITHQNLLSNSEIIRECFGNVPESRGVIWLPPYHDMGLIGGILQPVYTGCTVFMMSPISFLLKPLRWLQAISNFKAKVSGGPNFAYDLCVRKIDLKQCEELDLSSWDVAFTGAEPTN